MFSKTFKVLIFEFNLLDASRGMPIQLPQVDKGKKKEDEKAEDDIHKFAASNSQQTLFRSSISSSS